jgi:hypothetical protein
VSVTRLAAAIDALYAACVADSTLVARGTYISDGYPVTADAATELLVIGGDPDGVEQVASVSQEWHDSGAGSSPRRMEVLTVRCYAAVQSGDVDASATRTAAVAIVGAVESLLRTDRTLGLSDVIATEVVDLSYSLSQNGNGTAVWVPFTVRVRSLI